MQKSQILAVRDRQLNAYLRPFVAQSVGQAIRSFSDEVNNAQGDMHKHPEDYELFHLGEFDDETGVITAIPPKQVALGTHFKNRSL